MDRPNGGMRIESSSEWKEKQTTKEKLAISLEKFFRECDLEVTREHHSARIGILRDLRSRLSRINRNACLNDRTFRALLATPAQVSYAPPDDCTSELTTGIVKELYIQSIKSSLGHSTEDQRDEDPYDSARAFRTAKKVKRPDF